MKRLSREYLAVLIPAVLIAVAALWYTSANFVQPAPPTSFAISTSAATSPYYQLAVKIKKEAGKPGKVITVAEEKGASVANLALLNNPSSGVQAGFVQGGLTNNIQSPDLASMGRLITEPVWIFYRGAQKIDHITQLRGKRILIGPEPGGTSALARRLLEANGIDSQNSTLIPAVLGNYADMFANNSADAGFLVVGADHPMVETLLRQPGTNLMNMVQADALIQKYPFLTAVTMRQGVVDFAKNIPPSDTTLVATRAALLIRKDLHPALIAVLAEGIRSAQNKPSLDPKGNSKLFALGTDALMEDPEFPVPDEARRVYKNGLSFFYRNMPFGLASLLDRAMVMIFPIIGILLPLVRVVPMVYNWRMRRRILNWYRQLKNLESTLPKEASLDVIEQKELELERIEEGVRKISVPIHFSADLYNLRDHVEFVKRNIANLRHGPAKAAAPAVYAGQP